MSSLLEEYRGKTKAAMLLVCLGPEKSAKVFKHLKEEEIEALTLEIASLNAILPEVKEEVLEEFYQVCIAQKYIVEGGIGYAKQLLERSFGDDKANEIISKLTVSLQVRPFDFIRKDDITQVINFIQNEHPQTIALILSYLKPMQAGEILSSLAPEKQADVARRVAIMDRTNPDIIKEVEIALEKKISTLMTAEYTDVGGIDAIVEILNSVDRNTEKNIMDTLEAEEVELSEEIKKKMFVFEDLLSLDNRSIQVVLREDIDQKDIATALKGATEELQALIFNNLSKRLASMIKEDMDFMGPVRRTDVEEAQQKIVNVVRRLQETNQIVIARGGGDDVIV
ncbi:flagellar motor switch protein FliG [uncultured Tyzzerella sp.]|uniref:flagellar motor switch protein FliG n=1 Tax=uncultured Tyzzerella sp. TaxID=2321398 RepID=UPI002942C188|nr:flagellar motor switch protein FliG [uncultured Tyzzerella sp.]